MTSGIGSFSGLSIGTAVITSLRLNRACMLILPAHMRAKVDGVNDTQAG